MAKGNIGVTTENIFPVIKKFLYSDHEIFLREMVSNAVDAIQKLKTLHNRGEVSADVSDVKVSVILDKDAKTLTIRDNGIGMTEEEIDKYINQIAFSGGIAYGDEYSDAYMVFEGNTVTTYGPAGNKIRGGEWEVAMNDSESNGGRGDAGWELGKLTTSEPALLFPWKVNGGGTPVTEFDIMYYDANNITLVYTAGQSSGSWAEITHWCFVRK